MKKRRRLSILVEGPGDRQVKAFATIVTKSHIPAAVALAHSIARFDTDARLHVLVVDSMPSAKKITHISFHRVEELSDDVSMHIRAKYRYHSDSLRWALKPVFLRLLLRRHPSVIFVDPDVCFYQSSSFLFHHLEQSSVLLARHWRPVDPPTARSSSEYCNQFTCNFRDGHFNGGFVGVTRRALPILSWWAKACLFHCMKDALLGLYVDQKYLDLLPIQFEDVGILDHQGCDIAEWNLFGLTRRLVKGKVLINGRWPIVFIHFTLATVEKIERGLDPLLKPHLDDYREILRSLSPDYPNAERILNWRARKLLNLPADLARQLASRVPLPRPAGLLVRRMRLSALLCAEALYRETREYLA